MVSGYWRGIAAPIIAETIKANKGKTRKEIKAALREAYPFGERRMWPYKVWLSEIRNQLDGKPSYKQVNQKQVSYAELVNSGQLELFKEVGDGKDCQGV
jgi:hypothetical protein